MNEARSATTARPDDGIEVSLGNMMLDIGSGPETGAPAATGPAAPAIQTIHKYPVRFTGSGSEYFRIWIVNLLLTLVTLGLYYPWAKVRRLRYFYGNTQVDGHALDFHGNPKKMLRGTLAAGALLAVYSLAGNLSPTAGLVALVLIGLLWPVLFRSALQFRLAHTSWRGLRFSFAGGVKGAYLALGAPLAVLLLLALLLGGISPAVAKDTVPGASPALTPALTPALILLPLIGTLATLPYLLWSLKKYQHDHYGFGQLQTELRVRPGAVYLLCLKTLGLALAVALLTALVALLAGVFAGGLKIPGGGTARGNAAATVLIALLGLTAGMLVIRILLGSYFASRLQNLLWTKTGNRYLRFKSKLPFIALLKLQIKNWLLIAVTLGLYWPFAAVAQRRLQLQAVTLYVSMDLDALTASAQRQRGDAAGDAADDLLGIDVGL